MERDSCHLIVGKTQSTWIFHGHISYPDDSIVIVAASVFGPEVIRPRWSDDFFKRLLESFSPKILYNPSICCNLVTNGLFSIAMHFEMMPELRSLPNFCWIFVNSMKFWFAICMGSYSYEILSISQVHFPWDEIIPFMLLYTHICFNIPFQHHLWHIWYA